MRQYIRLETFIDSPHMYRLPFAEAYDLGLREHADDQVDSMETFRATHVFSPPPPGIATHSFYKNYCGMLLDAWMEALHQEGKEAQFGSIVRTMIEAGRHQFKAISHSKKVSQK